VPDPWPLRNIPVPPEVSRVEGCDCGGLEYHRADCVIFALPEAERADVLDAARDRLAAFTAALNARLHAEHPELGGMAR
jgi:hypothetical protein